MRYRILGPVDVSSDGPERELGAGRQRALLALLLLRRNEVVSVDRIVDALWGERPPATATKVVQGYVSQLRKALGEGALHTRSPGYLLEVSCGDLDVDRFEELVDRARREEPHEAGEMLREALALWRGPPLANLAYESFAQTEISRLEELRLAALEDRIDTDLALGRAGELVPELEALVREHPLRERFRAQAMLALYRAGRQADALQVYADARRRLRDELGLEPSADLQELQRRILDHDPELGRVTRRPLAVALPRARLVLAIGALLFLGGLVTAIVEVMSGGESPAFRGSAVGLVDPETLHVRKQIVLSAPATSLASGSGFLWALNGDSGTVTQIDLGTHRPVATFSTGGRPIDLAAGAGALWVLNGGTMPQAGVKNSSVVAARRWRGSVTSANLVRVDPQSRALQTIEIPFQGDFPLTVYLDGHLAGEHRLTFGAGSLWMVGPDQSVLRIDPRRGWVVATVPDLRASSIAFGDRAVWAVELNHGSARSVSVARIDPRTNRVDRRVTTPSYTRMALAVGSGAVWLPDQYTGEVWRVTPGPPPVIRSVPNGVGATTVGYGAGGVWVGNNIADAVSRIDPKTNRSEKTLTVPTPQAIEPTPEGVWIASGPAPSSSALPRSACGSLVYGGKWSPRFLIASDLSLRGSRSAATLSMAKAVAWTLRKHRFRAGPYTVGYQSCDDSTQQAGDWDYAQCVSNAQLFAKTAKVIGIVGTSNSGCTDAELPILNEAPNGPLAMVSPTNTSDILTRVTRGQPPDSLQHLYPTGIRNYVRVIGPDTHQVAAVAEFMSRLDLRRIAIVVDDGTAASQIHVRWFRHVARAFGLQTAIVRWHLAWSDPERLASGRRTATAVRGVRADGAFISAGDAFDAGFLIRALRRQLGTGFPIVGTDYLLPTEDLALGAGGSAVGTYVSFAGSTNDHLPPAGQRFLRAFGRDTPFLGAPYAAQATEVLLAAIGRSDGTRRSVARELFRTNIKDGILGVIRFNRYGDPVTAPVTIMRMKKGAKKRDPALTGAVVDRVISPPPRIIP